MKTCQHGWRVLFLICLVVLTNLMILVPLVMQADATKGTWVIENQTITVENNALIHEGDIIIRGTGKLALLNSSLTINQLLSWQFQIYVEDAGVLLIDDSDIKSKYPFKIICDDFSEINLTSSVSLDAKVVMSGNSRSAFTDTSLLGVSTNENSQTIIDSCSLHDATSNDDSMMVLTNSIIGPIDVNDDSQTNISSSHTGSIVVESSKTTTIVHSTADALRGWGESNIVVSDCTLGDYRYSDSVQASISNSSIGNLDATGNSPLTLNKINIGSAILRGSANVTMNECTIESIEVYLNSVITLWNSSCDDFVSSQYADVKILGDESAQSYFGDCIITQLCNAIITWSNFDYLEIGHSTTGQVNDSYAGYFYTWRYTTCIIDIWRCRFHELRSGSQVTMHDTIVEIWSNIGENFTAFSCQFWADATFYGSSTGYLENCTINPLRPQYESQVTIRNCTARVAILDYANRLRTVDSIPAGSIIYWNSDLSNALSDVQWNLTVYDSVLTGWDIAFRFNEDYTVFNSTLRRVEVEAQCSVMVGNSSIEEFVVSDGDTSVFQSDITSLEVQQSAHILLNQSICQEIWNGNSARSEYYNCTINRFHSYTLAQALFFQCNLNNADNSGNSYLYFENCTLITLGASNYAVTEVYDSQITNYLFSLHDTQTYVTNSIIQNIYAQYDAQINIFNSYIGYILLYHSSTAFVTNCTLLSLRCIGTSSLTLSGNLTDTTSCVIENSAQVIRELIFMVEDQLGNPLISATVEIFDSIGNSITSGVTNSQGRCILSVIFHIAGLNFFSTFSVVAIFNGFNTTVPFTTTTLQPLLLIIDSSESTSELEVAPADDLIRDTGVDESPIGDRFQLDSKLNLIDLCFYVICLAALSQFIILQICRHLIPNSRLLRKIPSYSTRIPIWVAIKRGHTKIKYEDVKT